MKSRKTSRLLYIIDGYICRGKKVLYINSSLDTRESMFGFSCVSSHNKLPQPLNCFDQIKVSELSGVNVHDYDFIAVDECQFFSDLVDVVLCWIRQGKDVTAVGLDLDYEAKPFGQTLLLAQFASTVKKLKGFCDECVRNGSTKNPNSTHTKRITSSKEKILIGDSNYEASCLYHFECRN